MSVIPHCPGNFPLARPLARRENGTLPPEGGCSILALARIQSVALVAPPKKKSPDWATFLYNGRHGHYNDLPEAKLIMPQASQREEQKQYYG
jgi:hypothetical protein